MMQNRKLPGAVIFAFVLSLLLMQPTRAAERLTIEKVETAGVNGLDWNKPFPDAKTMDAVHRSVLVRFPGAADKIAEALEAGARIEKVELLLDYAGYEVKPKGYIQRNRQKQWSQPPRWHVIGWLLRRPWQSGEQVGPTFNAYRKGVGFWTRFGAADTSEDRFPARMGPAEMSKETPLCRLDVTACLTNPFFGDTLGLRLRRLEENGLLLKKWELWDQRYDDWWGAYEWAKATGGHGLEFKNPRLVVTLAKAEAAEVDLPKPTDFMVLERRLKSAIAGDATAVLPTQDELDRLVAAHRMRQPDWMPDWQWERVKQLRKFGGGHISRWADGLESGDLKQYQDVVWNVLRTVPRYWKGWGIQDDLLLYYVYGDMLPGPALQSIHDYWHAWLMPWLPTDRFFHAQSKQNLHFWEKTGDWRGRKSFFRAGYNYTISTMNFNHTAAMGALLGGNIIDSERAMADGRHGLEYLPMRLWAWYDGTTQESIDHYYYAITLSGQKMFADFGPRRLDRMMGQSILAKSVEELTSSYHPGLRHFINTSGRTGISYLWVIQDGLQHIVHTLSHSGALHDLDNPETFGMPVFGNDARPGRIAIQTLRQPWAPEWACYMVDEKPIPYRMITADKVWGRFARTPLWNTVYLGRNYGVASADIGRHGSVPLMMQWRREEKQVDRVQELGTLLARYTADEPNLVTTHGGGGLLNAGYNVALQKGGKLLMVTTPLKDLPRAKPEKTRSLQSTIGLFNFQQKPDWKLHIDGKPINDFPVKLKAGQVITLDDGVTFLGMIPLPATDLGRTEEVVITDEAKARKLQGGGQAAPTLLIHSYNYLSDKTLTEANLPIEKIDRAYGGFHIEIGDTSEYAIFNAFQKHMQKVQVTTRWAADEGVLHVSCKSGEDMLELGFRPEYHVSKAEAVPTDQCFAYRRVNGKYPYLRDGLVRDSNLSQQGTAGRLEKLGAVLRSERGRMAYLQVEPVTGTVCGWNPLPDPAIWSLHLPDGASIEADGRVGLLRVVAQTKENVFRIDHVRKEKAPTGGAHALLFFGLKRVPTVYLNGVPYPRPLELAAFGERKAYVLPLDGRTAAAAAEGVQERYRRAREVLDLQSRKDFEPKFLQDWYVIGPFESRGSAPLWTRSTNHYPPEKEIKLDAKYEGFDRVDGKPQTQTVQWKRTTDKEEAALGSGPVVLARHLKPDKSVVGYAYTEITSDEERDVILYTGSDVRLTVWINDELVLRKLTFRAAAPDQDRTPIHLRKGVNEVLVKSANGWEGWSFYFRLGDEYGLPVKGTLSYGVDRK